MSGSADELRWLDATAQAELVRSRKLTPSELVQAAIRRIERVNLALNAVVHECFEAGLRHAAERAPARAPLPGVPFLLKDTGSAQAGVPKTQANVALQALPYTPVTDGPLGARFRAAGLVTVRVSNMPEFAQLGDTQPLVFGATRNPWDLDRSAGGSSGGAAAAVAAGLVPLAHGTDAAGSIRAPAGWCGVVGLKPSRGRMPRRIGSVDDIWDCEFVLTRTVRDAAAVLDALQGPMPGDLYGLPAGSHAAALRRPPDPLRVGVLVAGPPGVAVHPECAAAVEVAARLLDEMGHDIDRSAPDAFFEAIPDWVDRIRHADLFQDVIAQLGTLLGRPVTEADVEPYTWTRYLDSEPVSAAALRECLAWHVGRAARLVEWWERGFDLLVTPVIGEPPPLLAELAAESPSQMATTERRHAAFLEPFNASGQPAISVPIHTTAQGLPVGTQLVAQRGREDLLLAVAAELERATGWPDTRPQDRDIIIRPDV